MRFTCLILLLSSAATLASAQQLPEQPIAVLQPVALAQLQEPPNAMPLPAAVVVPNGGCSATNGAAANSATDAPGQSAPALPTSAVAPDTAVSSSTGETTAGAPDQSTVADTSTTATQPCPEQSSSSQALGHIPSFDPNATATTSKGKYGIHWGPLLEEEFNWIAFMHAKRVVFEPETRNNLGGPYFKDWFYILHHVNLTTWSDGGRWMTNNVFHSMEGGVASFIYKHNDDRVKTLEFDMKNPEYRKGIFKSWVAAAISSTEFEIGPVSEATIGHVGLHANAQGMNGTGWTDFIITPFAGAGEMVGEDAADKYITKRLENHLHSRPVIDTVRILTNPCRSMANVMEFKRPWHRDTRN